MVYTLNAHNEAYAFSCEDAKKSLFTGFSGAPYALRHIELANKNPEVSCGHRVIAALESIPGIGILIALIERVSVCVYNRIFNNVPPAPKTPVIPPDPRIDDSGSAFLRDAGPATENLGYEFDPRYKKESDATIYVRRDGCMVEMPQKQFYQEMYSSGKEGREPMSGDWIEGIKQQAREMAVRFESSMIPWASKRKSSQEIDEKKGLEKAQKNAQKALEEHKSEENQDVYVEALEKLSDQRESPSLKLQYFAHEALGMRSSMEDEHFYVKCANGNTLTGVLDGHGGYKVAEIVKNILPVVFNILIQTHHPHRALEGAFAITQNILKENKLQCGDAGCTAVVSYIQTGRIYTATIGDSEARVHRKNPQTGQLQVMPLSCVRDWASENDAKRNADYHDIPERAQDWPTRKDAARKSLRSMGEGPYACGANVSRAFGDFSETGSDDKPLITHKPKITVYQIEPGDVLLFACDGLWDFVKKEQEIIDILSTGKPATRAQRLVELSIRKQNMWLGTDNVTVVVIDIEHDTMG